MLAAPSNTKGKKRIVYLLMKHRVQSPNQHLTISAVSVVRSVKAHDRQFSTWTLEIRKPIRPVKHRRMKANTIKMPCFTFYLIDRYASGFIRYICTANEKPLKRKTHSRFSGAPDRRWTCDVPPRSSLRNVVASSPVAFNSRNTDKRLCPFWKRMNWSTLTFWHKVWASG